MDDDFNRSVDMTARCYSGPISRVSTNEPLLGETRCVQNFGPIFIYHIYFMGSSTFPTGCFKIRGKPHIPQAGYKYFFLQKISIILILFDI